MVKKVVIVLPTFNEKGNAGKFIQDVFAQEKDSPGWEYEILVVDDVGSNKESKDYLKEIASKNPKVHYIENSPSGLGVAIVEGHNHSLAHFKPDALAQLDADGQVEADVLPRLLKALDEGYDLALGSRFVKGGKNRLSLTRRIFTYGSSLVTRILMGPFNIREVTNSARAFTPELYKRINFKRMPWREKSFIIQPAFLHEAVLAGAKYKEVPLVFKNRAEGYSKNKVVNYTYDVIFYNLEGFFQRLGVNIPLFKISRHSKTFIKFGVVGVTGTIIDFLFYNLFIKHFGVPPATSKAFSTEIAIFNNFTWNNFWTFKSRKTNTNIFQKFGIFNAVALGGLAISVVIIKLLHLIYGDGYLLILSFHLAYYNVYFFVTIPFVLTWNFLVNHFVTWKNK